MKRKFLIPLVLSLCTVFSNSFALDITDIEEHAKERAEALEQAKRYEALAKQIQESLNSLKPDGRIRNSLFYLDVGVGPLPLPIPQLGLGYRIQNNHHGFDGGVSTIALWPSKAEKVSVLGCIKALYTFFPHPDLSGQYYFQIGPAGFFAAGEMRCLKDDIAPIMSVLKFGKQYKNKSGSYRFIEGEVLGLEHFSPFALFSIKYGFGF